MMTSVRAVCRTTLVLAAIWLAGAPSIALAQDALSRAKTLYASADYEGALLALDTLKGKPANSEAKAYQVFCLVALGRRDEARRVIESIVRADPMYRPSTVDVAPRIRIFFDDVRKPLLPEVARLAYAEAKSAFDHKDFAKALGGFENVMALIDEIDKSDPSAADLRTLTIGFRELARGATVRVTSAPVEPTIYGSQSLNVAPPTLLSRTLPEWHPNFFELNRTFSGDLELVIGEDGRVTSASLLTSVHPRYDAPLLESTKGWIFKPATRNGVPVPYRYVMTVQILK
jgi:tetratricopeptide (TPR) repeat protein